jgi:hypothetical protein
MKKIFTNSMSLLVLVFTFLTVLVISSSTFAANSKGDHSDDPAVAKEKEKRAKTVVRLEEFLPTKKPDAGKNIVPEKTVLESPTYFQAIQGATATLKWKAVEAANHYHLQVATDPNFKWLVLNEYEVAAPSYELKDLQPGQHYFWRVNAVIQNNEDTFRKSGFVTSMFETVK